MLFASTSLAARVERAECRLLTDSARAIAGRRPAADVFVLPLAGGAATCTAENSPLNKVAVAPFEYGDYKTVARGIPAIGGQIPCGLMAEEIEEASAGEQRMRGLVVICGNPVLSAPNGERSRKNKGPNCS